MFTHLFVLGLYAPIWDVVQHVASEVIASVQATLNANCPCL
jgi:hypothetical protein